MGCPILAVLVQIMRGTGVYEKILESVFALKNLNNGLDVFFDKNLSLEKFDLQKKVFEGSFNQLFHQQHLPHTWLLFKKSCAPILFLLTPQR